MLGREVADIELLFFRMLGSGAGLDLSPMVATFVLIIVGRIVVTLIQG